MIAKNAELAAALGTYGAFLLLALRDSGGSQEQIEITYAVIKDEMSSILAHKRV